MTNYTLHGKNIVHMTQGGNSLHFFYAANNKPAIVEYNGVKYAYVHNLQGDIVAILDSNGTAVVQYKYDAWGKPINKTGSLASTLGTIQPFRYREYVYDEETGLYYLRSRYYESCCCRFIIPDIQVGCIGLIYSHNMFLYCSNSPISLIDRTGVNPSPLPPPAPQTTPTAPVLISPPHPTPTPYPMRRPTPTPSPIPTTTPTPAPTIIPKPGMRIRSKSPSWNQMRIFNMFWYNNTLSTNSIIDAIWIDVFDSNIMWVEYHKTGRSKGNYLLKVTLGQKTVPTIWGLIHEGIGVFSDAEGFSLSSTYLAEGLNMPRLGDFVQFMGVIVTAASSPFAVSGSSTLFPLEKSTYTVIDYAWEALD